METKHCAWCCAYFPCLEPSGFCERCTRTIIGMSPLPTDRPAFAYVGTAAGAFSVSCKSINPDGCHVYTPNQYAITIHRSTFCQAFSVWLSHHGIDNVLDTSGPRVLVFPTKPPDPTPPAPPLASPPAVEPEPEPTEFVVMVANNEANRRRLSTMVATVVFSMTPVGNNIRLSAQSGSTAAEKLKGGFTPRKYQVAVYHRPTRSLYPGGTVTAKDPKDAVLVVLKSKEFKEAIPVPVDPGVIFTTAKADYDITARDAETNELFVV